MRNVINQKQKESQKRRGGKTRLILGMIMMVALSFSMVSCGNKNDDNENETIQAATNTADTQKEEAKETELKVVKLASPTQDGNFVENAKIAQDQGFIEEELAAVGYTEYVAFAQAGPAINEAFVSDEIDIDLVDTSYYEEVITEQK